MAAINAMASTSATASLVVQRRARSLSARGCLLEKSAALLSQTRGRRPGTRRGRAHAITVEAKIWTDDGRRRAADLMGLTREEASDAKTLKRAFRKLCLRYHPDIAREDGAVEKFNELQEAYRVLASDDNGFADLPDDLEWSTHDWRWAARYKGTGDVDEDDFKKMEEIERKAKLEQQLAQMAGAPTRRRRRVVKVLSKEPTPVPSAAQFTEVKKDADADEGEDCPSDGCSSDDMFDEKDLDSMTEEQRHAYTAFQARKTRGYQSDRHSTESAHERLNSQLAGLHRKKVIRQRATGEVFEDENRYAGSAARYDSKEHIVRDETNSSRFYGGVGLQLEESTPERFLRLAKLAREWREQRSLSDAIFSADIIKPSAKELLQAAVEGVSLGACT